MKVTRRTREIRKRILPFVMSLVMVLTINPTAYAADALTITTQPASQAVEEGQSAGFSVAAEGTGPLSYQWQKDGIDISGETSATLDIPNVRGVNSGSYTVVVTDAADNSVTSDAATLTTIKITIFQGVSDPSGIAVDSSGNIYVADSGNNAVKKMDAGGNNIVTLGSGFRYPCSVAVDDSGYIYVADSDNNAIKKMDADGNNIVTLGSGFNCPSGVAADSSGNIYVADSNNNAVKKMDADGNNIVTLGSDFSYPCGVAVDGSGNIYVADSNNNAIKRMNANGSNIVTLGLGFDCPCGVAVDGSGNIYVADSNNNAVKKMDADGGNIVTLGLGFASPCGVAVDGSGNIYVADSGNNAVKKMDAGGNNIVTLDLGFDSPCGVAADGSGNIYIADSGANAVKKMDADGNNIVTLGSGFSNPWGVAVDGSGNIYVADTNNNAVKKMDADGSNIVTLGSGPLAGFNHPRGVAVDSSGDIYVADSLNNAIKRINASGLVWRSYINFNYPSGIAVDGSGNFYVANTNNNAIVRVISGDRISVSGFNRPYGVAVGSSGSIYVADTINNAVKKMDADGNNIMTLGSGFNAPYGIAADSSGNIYVADTFNNAIKKIQLFYGVAYNSNGSTGGSVPVDGNSYKQGDAVTVVGNTGNLVRTGYIFAGWNTAADGSGISYGAGATATMPAGNLTLYAIWEDIPAVTHTVSVSASPAAGGNVIGSGTYCEGASVTVTAAVYSGYSFVNWTEGGSEVSTNASYTFTLGTSDRTLVANFTQTPSDITKGTISGMVTDGTNPVSGANVSLTVSGSVYSTTTIADGSYSILNVPAGTGYTVTAYKAGYNNGSAANVSVTANAVTSGINITLSAIPATHTVTYHANGGSGTAPTESDKAEGSTFAAAVNTFTAPSGKQFKHWNTAQDGTGTSYAAGVPITMPANALDLYAIWENTPGSGGGGSTGSGGGSSTPTTPTYNANITAGSGAETKLPVTVNKDRGNASVDVSSQGSLSGGTVITIPSIPGVDTFSVGIPVPYLSTGGGQGTLTLNTDAGSITVSSNMLTGVSGISGSKADITIGQGDKDSLPDDVKSAIGDKPLIQLKLSIDGKQTDWNNPSAPVTVSIPYTPTAAELANPESIVIWYIDGSGNVVTIPNGSYDLATGTVTFSTTHFSDYAVAYHKVSFNDVAPGAWYNKAVSFIAARGITGGTGDANYSPESKLTRGEFIVLMMRAYGIAPDTNPTDNFSDSGSTYYTGYLAAAKRLGISAGIGNNMYAPGREIARQEMFTLLYNALKVIGQLPQSNSGKALSDFTDPNSVADWAEEAMTLLVKTGTIDGSNGTLTPLSTTTRAEMAQVLYNLLRK